MWEIIFCCGVPFFFIALGLWYVGVTYWPDHFRITYVPFLNNELGNFLVAVTVLLILTLGCFAGFLLQPVATSATEVTEEGWVLLAKSPQEIKTLRAADFFTVFAETIDGQLIACYYESAYDNDCWYEVSQIPDTIESKCGNWRGKFSEPPSSINVIERIDIENCYTFAGMDSINISSYVLSDEGQVYQNTYGNPSFFPPAGLVRMQCFFSVLGLIVGFLIILGLMSVNKRRNMYKTKTG